MSWAESFILSYDDARYFKRTSAGTVENLFVDWLIEHFGLRNFYGPASKNRWEFYSAKTGEPYGVKVVFKNKDDAMLFKLRWM